MTVIKQFEDLIAWQEARQLSRTINVLSKQGTLERDFALRDQMRRAALSVMTNIAEGFDCESRAEFARFLTIARRSAVEVQSLLYSAMDDGHIDKITFDSHHRMAGRTKYIINKLRQSLNTNNRGVGEESVAYTVDTDDPDYISVDSDTNDTSRHLIQ